MAGENGIWLLFAKSQHPERGEHARLIGRFAVHGGNISIMEDHANILGSIFPPGVMGAKALRRMRALENGQSAYYELVREDELNEGQRMDLVPEMDLGAETWPNVQE